MFRLSTKNDNLIGMCDQIIYGHMVQNAIRHERKYFEWNIICDWSVRVCVSVCERGDFFCPDFILHFIIETSMVKFHSLVASCTHSSITWLMTIPCVKRKIELDKRATRHSIERDYFIYTVSVKREGTACFIKKKSVF